MDRMIYLSMSGAKATMQRQDVLANNLANVSTAGFREELQAFRAVPVRGDGASTRVYALESTPGHSDAPGVVQSTGRALDVAARALGPRRGVQPVAQRRNQRIAPLAVGEQVVLQIRVALHDPDVAQHLVQHARRAAGDALGAQRVEHRPGLGAEQADDDLAVGERGVVVRNFAQALAHWATGRLLQGSGPF